MSLPRKPHIGTNQRGFTMVELLAAVVIFNLLIIGLTKLFIGQNSMVEDLEDWAEGNPVLYVSQEADPIARALGMPANLVSTRIKAVDDDHEDETEYTVEVIQVHRQAGSESATARFLQTKSEDFEKDHDEDEDEDKDEDDDEDDKESKHRKGRDKK